MSDAISPMGLPVIVPVLGALALVAAVPLAGWGLFSLRDAQERRSQARVEIAAMQERAERLARLVALDGAVILEADHDRAIAGYRELATSALPELHPLAQERLQRVRQIRDGAADLAQAADERAREDHDGRQRDLKRVVRSVADEILQEQSDSRERILTELARVARLAEQADERSRIQAGRQFLSFKDTKGATVYYIGHVEAGRATGRGIGVWRTGSVYEGEWANNHRHGVGSFEWADGERYEGAFVEDKRTGQGTYYWVDGQRYVGAWKDGRRNGQGTLFDKEGEVIYAGGWKDDKPTSR